MEKAHRYITTLNWTGNKGEGTANYKAYDRDHVFTAPGKPDLPGSSDPSFRGNPTRYNPEELLVASLSSCHMLWYLHLCSINDIIVVDYQDKAEGVMMERTDGSGYFAEVTLRPVVTITNAERVERARELHHEASRVCFIASSVNFPVHHSPEIKVTAVQAR